jgi:pectate lyase
MDFKKVYLCLALMGTVASAAPNFSMMGFATTDGGTTGGNGGKVVTPTTLVELKQYAEDKTTPYVIRITKEFTTGVNVSIDSDGTIGYGGKSTTYGDIVKLGSNKTLVGIGSSAFFNRIGIIIQCQSNIIIRNIKFTMKDVPISKTDENKIVGWVNGAAKTLSDPDCIGIQADDTAIAEASQASKHIWIDHCEFFNEDPSVMTEKDRYDGLVDSKNNSTNITISWCYFHDHHKASLAGKSGSDVFDRRITYSHNYFNNIASRLPLLRWAKCHLLNNYMSSCENGVDDCFSSDVYVEANSFENTKKPIFGDGTGFATFVNNSWATCSKVPAVMLSQASGAKALSSGEEVKSGGSIKSLLTYSYTADAASSVSSTVTANAGVGKINTDEYNPTAVITTHKTTEKLSSVYVKDRQIFVRAVPGTSIRILNSLGATVYSGKATVVQSALALPVNNGVYLVKMGRNTETLVVHVP